MGLGQIKTSHLLFWLAIQGSRSAVPSYRIPEEHVQLLWSVQKQPDWPQAGPAALVSQLASVLAKPHVAPTHTTHISRSLEKHCHLLFMYLFCSPLT